MDDFAIMHLFFFIASFAAIILAVLFIVMIFFFIQILIDIKYISGKAKKEADFISEDLSELRGKVRAGGFKLRHFVGFIQNIFKHHKK